jgi:hypothetical protein
MFDCLEYLCGFFEAEETLSSHKVQTVVEEGGEGRVASGAAVLDQVRLADGLEFRLTGCKFECID